MAWASFEGPCVNERPVRATCALAGVVRPPCSFAREHVNQKHAVICACIVAAFREVSTHELSRQFLLRKRERPGEEIGAEDDEVSFLDGAGLVAQRVPAQGWFLGGGSLGL